MGMDCTFYGRQKHIENRIENGFRMVEYAVILAEWRKPYEVNNWIVSVLFNGRQASSKILKADHLELLRHFVATKEPALELKEKYQTDLKKIFDWLVDQPDREVIYEVIE
jgi:hypothetical protein